MLRRLGDLLADGKITQAQFEDIIQRRALNTKTAWETKVDFVEGRGVL